MTNQTFAHLKALSNQDGKDFPTKRIALLADTSSQYLAKAIRGEGISRSLNLELFEADYNQIELQLFQPGSELQEFSPETVIVYQDVTKLRRSFHKVAPSERSVFAEQQIASVERYYEAATKAGASSFLYCNFPVLPDAVFGNFANKTDDSFVWQSRELNLGVMKMASKLAGFHVCDVSALAARIGYERALDRRMYVNADVAMSFDFLPVVAQNVVDVLLSLQGKVKKCLILDLDNTVWGGVIGDDGMANIQLGDLGVGKAFTDLQLWAKQLATRGIILAVCVVRTPSPSQSSRSKSIRTWCCGWTTLLSSLRTGTTSPTTFGTSSRF